MLDYHAEWRKGMLDSSHLSSLQGLYPPALVLHKGHAKAAAVLRFLSAPLLGLLQLFVKFRINEHLLSNTYANMIRASSVLSVHTLYFIIEAWQHAR
jgi:hypothetical protein